MNTVDKLLSGSKSISGVIAFLCLVGMLVIFMAGLVAAERQVDDLVYEATALSQQIWDQQQLIIAQQELLLAYEEQNTALASLLDQAVITLQAVVSGPYSREEIKEKVLGIAEIIQEVNTILDPTQAEEISQVIVTNALAANIDPLLLLSVAITESHCRPVVRGGSGEYGMMQVMPSTGRWIAGRLGYQEFKPEDLMDLKTNIQFAAFYLRISIREFGGDVYKGLLAYNRGSRQAREWLQEHSAASHQYVRKVMNTYEEVLG